jgi:hypothetical protein
MIAKLNSGRIMTGKIAEIFVKKGIAIEVGESEIQKKAYPNLKPKTKKAK